MTRDVFQIGGNSGVLLIGDSLVAGEGATDDFGWAQRVAEDYGADVVAICGATSGDLLAHLPAPNYATVIVQIGTNDARFRHHANATETSLFKLTQNLQGLTQHFRPADRSPDFYFVDTLFVDEARSVLFKPDRSYFSKDNENASRTLYAFCNAEGHDFIPLAHISRDPERLTDGLHPNEATHREIYANVRRSLRLPMDACQREHFTGRANSMF